MFINLKISVRLHITVSLFFILLEQILIKVLEKSNCLIIGAGHTRGETRYVFGI